MIRLKHLVLPLVLAFASPVLAQTDFSAPIVARLEGEGYVVSEIRRTLLGRTLIVSRKDTVLREVVLNRFTGEIMRDRLFGGYYTLQPPADVATGAGDDNAGDVAGEAGGDADDAAGDHGNGNGNGRN
jgi:hypothetical protein